MIWEEKLKDKIVLKQVNTVEHNGKNVTKTKNIGKFVMNNEENAWKQKVRILFVAMLKLQKTLIYITLAMQRKNNVKEQ